MLMMRKRLACCTRDRKISIDFDEHEKPQPQDSADVSLNYYYLPLTLIQIECQVGTHKQLPFAVFSIWTLFLSSLYFWFHSYRRLLHILS